jgi:hypothetical protein
MMIAVVGSNRNVRGIRRAIVTEQPNPGRTPMKVPTKTPMRQYHRFVTERLTEKPS